MAQLWYLFRLDWVWVLRRKPVRFYFLFIFSPPSIVRTSGTKTNNTIQKQKSTLECDYYAPSVQFCGYCSDTAWDSKNCGNCGHECAFDAACVNSQCTFCTYNCSADTDFCTVEPCNITTGCSIFDCATDGNPCTLDPCNSTLGGCTPLNCETDGDFCSIGTCDPANGGCAIRNCTASGDPCLADPCINGACAYQCPVLQLARKLTKFLVICDNNFSFLCSASGQLDNYSPRRGHQR